MVGAGCAGERGRERLVGWGGGGEGRGGGRGGVARKSREWCGAEYMREGKGSEVGAVEGGREGGREGVRERERERDRERERTVRGQRARASERI